MCAKVWSVVFARISSDAHRYGVYEVFPFFFIFPFLAQETQLGAYGIALPQPIPSIPLDPNADSHAHIHKYKAYACDSHHATGITVDAR